MWGYLRGGRGPSEARWRPWGECRPVALISFRSGTPETRPLFDNHFPVAIAGMTSMGQRIVAWDVQESVHFIRYKRRDNQLVVFCDDTTPRYVTSLTMLDYQSVAIGDKFGSIAILRLPQRVNEDVHEDPLGTRALWERGYLNGASQKADLQAVFYVGDLITTLQKTSLVPGAGEALVYSTIGGQIGMLVPFMSREEHDLLQNLEMHMRVEFPPLCGRDHLAFRSYYHPCKSVIDGDLCEQFSLMDATKQKTVAAELGKKPNELLKKLEDIRTRFAF
ncbi:unnamed protein product, partial [Mesorhabditis belari]|uniref:Cleavage/polyadenylation specificity factor A subunit C-terminal domain-containing protein n=1 Tax=Mesorhabditis belari TaxID=2138241 RepID=A0AAF3J605_9BILA